MRVKEVMTADPVCCTADTPIPAVARMMVDNDCGEIPVVEDQASKLPIGVVTDRDIVCRLVAKGINPAGAIATECMSKPIVTVTPDMSIEECSQIMEENQIRRVPVVDERGCCCGIVALADIARQTRKDMAGEVVKEVSQPTATAAGAR
ncbi:MAG TPA: CBS domain-containing protein [Pyrinomonadaceae bacterium]|nr:CBS domain-containing protein [Pyrinomonadaceae bacterium]